MDSDYPFGIFKLFLYHGVRKGKRRYKMARGKHQRG
jgi:hypothetical protein